MATDMLILRLCDQEIQNSLTRVDQGSQAQVPDTWKSHSTLQTVTLDTVSDPTRHTSSHGALDDWIGARELLGWQSS